MWMLCLNCSSPTVEPSQLSGEFKVFDLSAIPIEDTDPFTGADFLSA